MNQNKIALILERAREVFSNVNLKVYLYALATIAVIGVILINVSSPSKYAYTKNNNKEMYIDIEKIARDYNLIDENEDENRINYNENIDANITEDLSKSLYYTNLYLEQNGITDPTLRGKFLANIILSYESQVSGRKYTKSDLKIIREENKENLQDYYDNIRNSFDTYNSSIKSANTKYSTPANEAEWTALRNSVNADLQKTVDATKNLISNLLSIPATEQGADYQIQLINIFSKQIAYLQSLMQIEIDPGRYLLTNSEMFITNLKPDLISVATSFYDYFKRFGVKIRN